MTRIWLLCQAMAGGGGRGDGVAADAALAGPSEPDVFHSLSLVTSLSIG